MVRMAYVWLLTMTRNAAIQTGMVVWLLHLYICIYTYVWNTHAKGPVLHDARRGGETTVERCYMCNGHLSSFHLLYAIYIYKNTSRYTEHLWSAWQRLHSLQLTQKQYIHVCRILLQTDYLQVTSHLLSFSGPIKTQLCKIQEAFHARNDLRMVCRGEVDYSYQRLSHIHIPKGVLRHFEASLLAFASVPFLPSGFKGTCPSWRGNDCFAVHVQLFSTKPWCRKKLALNAGFNFFSRHRIKKANMLTTPTCLPSLLLKGDWSSPGLSPLLLVLHLFVQKLHASRLEVNEHPPPQISVGI